MNRFWEFLLDDPPSNPAPSDTAGSESATPAPSPSLLSNPPDGSGAPAGDGAEGATLEGGEAAGVEQGLRESESFTVAALTLPEGITIDEADGAALAELLNNAELSPQERGQKLVDQYLSMQERLNKAGQDAAIASWNTMNEQWRAEVQALPEFTGDFPAKMGEMKQALVTLGADEKFFAALDLTGAGNHPQILQMLHKLTRPYVEGGSVGGQTTSLNSHAAQLAALYPTMQPKG